MSIKGNIVVSDFNGVCVLSTSKGEHFIIDSEDLQSVSKYPWYVGDGGYIRTKSFGENINLHVFLLPNLPKGKVRDHINRNKFDNRKENLRFVSNRVNAINCDRLDIKKYIGVHSKNKYFYFKFSNKGSKTNGIFRLSTGYLSALDAAVAYDQYVLSILPEEPTNLSLGRYSLTDLGVDSLSHYIPKRWKRLSQFVGVTKSRRKNSNNREYFVARVIISGGRFREIKSSKDELYCAFYRDKYIISFGLNNKLNFTTEDLSSLEEIYGPVLIDGCS